MLIQNPKGKPKHLRGLDQGERH